MQYARGSQDSLFHKLLRGVEDVQEAFKRPFSSRSRGPSHSIPTCHSPIIASMPLTLLCTYSLEMPAFCAEGPASRR